LKIQKQVDQIRLGGERSNEKNTPPMRVELRELKGDRLRVDVTATTVAKCPDHGIACFFLASYTSRAERSRNREVRQRARPAVGSQRFSRS